MISTCVCVSLSVCVCVTERALRRAPQAGLEPPVMRSIADPGGVSVCFDPSDYEVGKKKNPPLHSSLAGANGLRQSYFLLWPGYMKAHRTIKTQMQSIPASSCSFSPCVFEQRSNFPLLSCLSLVPATEVMFSVLFVGLSVSAGLRDKLLAPFS